MSVTCDGGSGSSRSRYPSWYTGSVIWFPVSISAFTSTVMKSMRVMYFAGLMSRRRDRSFFTRRSPLSTLRMSRIVIDAISLAYTLMHI